MRIVEGTTDNRFFAVTEGRKCRVQREYFYNGEFWMRLADLDSDEVFDSPSVFWRDVA